MLAKANLKGDKHCNEYNNKYKDKIIRYNYKIVYD